MTSEQHQIKTLDEMIDVASAENLKTLLHDFSLWLAIHVGLKGNEAVSAGRTFIWNDDNDPGIAEVRVRRTSALPGSEEKEEGSGT